jgi:uncharacterized protein (DUF2141 family)
MRTLRILAFVGLILALGCSKPGPGGKASINVDVVAGTVTSVNSKVYIKYDTKSSPGESPDAYDDVKVTNSSGQAYFTNLKKGDYFIYAVDDLIAADTAITIDKRVDVHEITLQMQ